MNQDTSVRARARNSWFSQLRQRARLANRKASGRERAGNSWQIFFVPISRGLPAFLTLSQSCALSEGRFSRPSGKNTGLCGTHLRKWGKFLHSCETVCDLISHHGCPFEADALIGERPRRLSRSMTWRGEEHAQAIVLIPPQKNIDWGVNVLV